MAGKFLIYINIVIYFDLITMFEKQIYAYHLIFGLAPFFWVNTSLHYCIIRCKYWPHSFSFGQMIADLPCSSVHISLSASEIDRLTDHIIAKSKDTYDLVASVPLGKVCLFENDSLVYVLLLSSVSSSHFLCHFRPVKL